MVRYDHCCVLLLDTLTFITNTKQKDIVSFIFLYKWSKLERCATLDNRRPCNTPRATFVQ